MALKSCSVARFTKARNIAERCQKKHVASVRRTLRKARELSDADAAERLIRNLARRMKKEAPGVSGSIPEGVVRCFPSAAGSPPSARRAPASSY